MLICRTCKLSKVCSEFDKQTKSKTGYQGECKQCRSIRMKNWYKTLTEDQKAIRKQRSSDHRKSDPENHYWTQMMSKYKLTQDDFNKILESQNYSCAICYSKEPGHKSGRWSVDHDHNCCAGTKSCGKCVRGLLCNSCNHGLGNFRDSIASLANAIIYLGEA